ncbi:MAG: efflux RND transporter periplasmic adaptor subunit [Planctomycetes bacterium]|nr:efflux RND transporter periplasmic adaptor subunit [Planctomycetota bacterium]MBI3833071.1 efflux RND transporter periplasmic adaptor subunit [Planctomycetota bacterium]
MMQYRISAGLVCICLILAGCGKENSTSAATVEQVNNPSASDGKDHIVHLAASQLSNIQVESVREQSLPMVLNTFGKVQFNEDRTAVIVPPLSGHVENLKACVGDQVQQGDVLFLINSRDVSAAISEYLESKKDLDLAEKTLAMTRDLFSHQAVSSIALQQAENDCAKAKNKVARTQEQLHVLDVDQNGILESGELTSRIPVRSPLSGAIVERHVTERQFIQPDNSGVLTIADLSSIWVIADVFEKDLRRVKLGQSAEVSTLAYPDEVFQASVSRISSVVDAQSRTVKVRFLVENSQNRLKPEMFADVRLLVETIPDALVLPAPAVFTEGGKNYVFVRSDKTNFTDRPVTINTLPNQKVRVIDGLKAGEDVVTQGTLLLLAQNAPSADE